MAQVVAIHETGGPDVLAVEEAQIGHPGSGELRIRQIYCGVNYIDTYLRSGLYKVPLPFIPGQEAIGEVVEVGPDAGRFRVGDRVVYFTMAGGGYASERILSSALADVVPDFVDDKVAAALTLKGLTAHMLLRQVVRIGQGSTILVHAAAGGVGSVLCQWAAHLGAVVIGTVGSVEKVSIARQQGCSEVIVYTRDDFVTAVRDFTGGKLCDVVFDGVGRATAIGSLDCLKPRGMFVNFGNASGVVDTLGMPDLARRGSLFATRPMLPDYTSPPDRRAAMLEEFYGTLANGIVKPPAIKVFSLADAATAHRELELRSNSGCLVLKP